MGKTIVCQGTMATTIGTQNPFRYRGYYYDHESGFYYLNSRYYDPDVGRFINADTTDVLDVDQDSLIENNLFAYCLNNPVNMADSEGEIAWFVAAALGGALVDTALYLVGNAIAGKKSTWGGAGKAALVGALSGVAFGAIGNGVKAVKTAIYANKAYKAGKASLAAGKAVKVIGHYPAYTKLSTKLSVKPFEISSSIWNKMTKTQQWTANQKFLDRAIKKGSDFVLATPYSKMKSGSYLKRETTYLISKGYKVSSDGLKLIRR